MTGVYKGRNLDNSTGMNVAGGAVSGAALGTEIAPGYGTAIGAGLGALYGIWQSSQAKKRASDLAKEKQNVFSEDPAMTEARNQANERAKQGFTNVQNSIFLQNLARARQLRQHNAVQMAGGSLAQAVNSQNTAFELNALNTHAGQDAQLQQDNIRYASHFAQNLQQLKNLQTSHDQQYRIMREQAIGQAGQAGGYNTITNAQTGIGAAADIYARAKGLGGQSGTTQQYPWQMPNQEPGIYPPQEDYGGYQDYLPKLKNLYSINQT